MNKTKIEWCDVTWNPVWGCLNQCEYCYARKIAKRFAYQMTTKECNYFHLSVEDREVRGESYFETLSEFKPFWLESNFQKNFPEKPSRIFVNSMSDIEYWKPEWMNRVLQKIKECPQHTFLFLTKDMDVYLDYKFPDNCYLGYTITNQDQYDFLMLSEDAYYPEHRFFLSIEPLQSKIDLSSPPDWLIIGAETGNRKNKIVPQREWIEALVYSAKKNNIPVFMKNSLKPIWGNNLIQEYPK